MNTTLYTRVKAAGIAVYHACEVGVYLPHTSNILGFIDEGMRATLVEADPATVEKLHAYFSHQVQVTIIGKAVYHRACDLEFCKAEASTFVKELEASPALVNDRFDVNGAQTFTVKADTFDTMDDGTIDVLSIDTEGCEWYVVQSMKSRPAVISIETGIKRYVNPHLSRINAWMDANGYVRWYRDGSDTVYVRRTVYRPGVWERMRSRLGI
ncbi:MAG: FkbM family methyltransferase [Candidatus Kapaibacterium sp.]